ncbi:hypothetical protein BU23DRAFT_637981 [Bimuria novae-zelandiae CBS 107.79]|uniref:Glycoside hydrolase n=1 Tax=Bimuria novae-zelandiae CBS 107.79 TaxID=1447943 RepID=A0A6A5VEK8_9PLEO|nr:hypothetical protein BU23DRAFT_637981 [Bimuria novae-zelandiae CBS 107.79]
MKQLVVDGKTFLMLGGELQNSSMSSAEFMSEVWPTMAATNVNTLLGCVPWEMIEPEEGAREHGLHLILLWFGSWKNGRSTYVPSWIKTNPERFPRAEIRKAGGVVEIADVLSSFHEQKNEADVKAFEKLLSHVKEIYEGHNTVLMVQVENEVGLLFDSRDGSAAANEQFAKHVPEELLKFLAEDYDNLNEDLRANLKTFVAQSKPQSGTWEEVFGKGPKTDELFMAYHYALFVNRVAAAGKKAYQLTLYTNVWQNYAGDDSDNDFPIVVGGGGMPGDYPSGGAIRGYLCLSNKAQFNKRRNLFGL